MYKIKQSVLTLYLTEQQPSNTIPHVFVVDWNNKGARAQVFNDQRTQNDSDPISQYWNTDLPDYCHRASAPLRELLSEWNSKILIIEYFSMHRILPTTEKSFLDTEEYKVAISTIIKWNAKTWIHLLLHQTTQIKIHWYRSTSGNNSSKIMYIKGTLWLRFKIKRNQFEYLYVEILTALVI